MRVGLVGGGGGIVGRSTVEGAGAGAGAGAETGGGGEGEGAREEEGDLVEGEGEGMGVGSLLGGEDGGRGGSGFCCAGVSAGGFFGSSCCEGGVSFGGFFVGFFGFAVVSSGCFFFRNGSLSCAAGSGGDGMFIPCVSCRENICAEASMFAIEDVLGWGGGDGVATRLGGRGVSLVSGERSLADGERLLFETTISSSSSHTESEGLSST